MKKSIYKFIFHRLMGWKISGTGNPEIKKCVYMILPHTSWHDFYIGALTRGVLDFEINFVGKKELFDSVFGFYFKYMGGAALDRKGGLNKVDAIVEIFKSKDIFRLGISPEGTRKKVKELKTGFYFIAQKANVPIIPVAFNYKSKTVLFGNPFWCTNNYENDLSILKNHFKNATGKIPQNDFTF